jgi:YesN/AraC family two-component response regulator
MKLLIAEDEAIIRMDLKETLQDLGYEIVAEARSGREAVQKAFAFAPDCAYGCPYGWR